MKRGREPARASRAHRPHQPSGGGVGLADAFEPLSLYHGLLSLYHGLPPVPWTSPALDVFVEGSNSC